MKKHKHTGELGDLVERIQRGDPTQVDFVFELLQPGCGLVVTRFVDYALSLVESPDCIARVRYYLFHGNEIQRNYASLYFNRRYEWPIVKQAYEKGLIDQVQAFAR